MHGVQIWLALPDAHEDDAPSFEHHPAATLPAIAPADGVHGHVLLGAAFGARSPVRHPSEPLLVDLELAAGAAFEVPGDTAERAVFVIEGELQIADQGLGANRLAVLGGDRPVRAAASAPTRALILGGPPLGPRFIEWNFVSSSRDKIDRARERWKAQQFAKIPTDPVEFIPWPELHRR
jgi:redox-sensitive bicupin YhaK (pirin superfamily)